MYNEDKLLEKIQSHLNENETKLLKSLIEDVDEFNRKFGEAIAAMFIDYDNIGTDGEFDPYETFQIKFLTNKEDIKYIPIITSELSLKDLDNALCAISQYFEELYQIRETENEILCKDNDKILEHYYELKKENKILFQDGEGLKIAKLENLNGSPIESILYDINRLPEIIIASRNNDKQKWNQEWINDLALVELVKYYYNKCNELESKLKVSEDKNIVNNILK